MTVRFFVRDPKSRAAEEAALPDGLKLTAWQPRGRRGPPVASLDPLRWAVWLQDRCGLFADGRYTELSLWSGNERVHRLVVTPGWYRFPFMAAGDLQIGAVWTHPARRRQGLARAAMAEAHRRFAGSSQRFWYLADDANPASMALARAAGYRTAGEGRRTKPVGIALIGRFEFDREALTAD